MLDAKTILGPDGAIARRLGSEYEPRPQQLEMAAAVDRAFDDGSSLLVEAGTGVGKSFAYLLPAIRRIVENNERVIISTHTISLQEQLIEKDIPLLQAVLGAEFSAVLVKGRGNYVSVRRLMGASQRQDQIFHDEAEFRSLHTIEDWAYRTDDGTLSTLPVLERMGVWNKVQSDSGNCMGRKCPTYDKCFYQSARRRMENGDLLVVNHALFFADLAMRASGIGILPPYDRVVLDEAHTIEDVAGGHFGLSLSDSTVNHLMTSLFHRRHRKGFLTSVRLKKDADRSLIERAIDQVNMAQNAADECFEAIANWQAREGKSNGRVNTPPAIEQRLSESLKELVILLRVLSNHVAADPDRFELNGYLERAEAYGATLRSWLDQRIEDAVYWIDISQGRWQRITLSCAPIDVAPLLRRHLFGATHGDQEPTSVVLTSATLATGVGPDKEAPSPSAAASFAHLSGRLGCENSATLQLGSPYDYATRVRLIIEPRYA